MIDHTTALYCITADLLKAAGHTDDVRSQLTDAEVVTTALVATLYFGGNIERSRSFIRSTGLMPRMLSKVYFQELTLISPLVVFTRQF